ncbi:type VI secretion system-associated protein TagF [Caballeronia sp. BR00000012568055]|uniref:type VI secretion system-associated protein TagF n=1 Tax=Caballeronia sp. BR00000012568055 TaxID=2918761 RepID=UPI0023F7CC81
MSTPASSGEIRAAGWYGKLPALGDFASRRLPASFVAPWDRWLAAGLQESRARLGEAWLPAYLSSPVWRFFAMPDALGAPPGDPARACWSGVVMPSVDRVGRYFPLTIAAPFDAAPASTDTFTLLWRWLHEIERIALAALRFDRPVSWLEAHLAEQTPPGMRAGRRAWPKAASIDACSVWTALKSDRAEVAGTSANASADAVPRYALWIAPGLPDAELFVTLLTGGRS